MARSRLDRVLSDQVPSLSRARVKALIDAGHVSIDGQKAVDAATKVRPGQRLVLVVPPPADPTPQAEALPLDVVFEDRHLIVIDKQAGLVVHPAAGHWSGTLVNALIAHCGDDLSGIGGVRRPGIVHRLDRDTTGLMVIAKTDAAHAGLAAQFADHGRTGPLERAYQALVWGVPDRSRFTIDAPLDRDTRNRERRAVRPQGRTAITHVTLGGSTPDALVSRVTCRLETGRTHQIRVHMAHVSHPLLGDELYGSGFRSKAARLTDPARAALHALGRQALHAGLLGFEHPVTGQTLVFERAPPADMARLMMALGLA